MSQLSQFSEGGLSDIISDVDGFIEENGIRDDVGHLLYAVPIDNVDPDEIQEEEELKPIPADFFVFPPPYPHEEQFPPDQPINLGTEEYSGPFEFEVLIIPNEQKTPWEYSPQLNKIFIGINLKFPVAFSVKNRPNTNLYVRATPVFSQSQFFQEFVHRCTGHAHHTDASNKGLSAHIFQHIIRCTNEKTRYFGDKDDKGRPNVVIPLTNPQVGTDVVKEFYHFVCKNSCPQGMNRRPIDIIFTLEDKSGAVFGRRIVSVRVCSCPKRDREKEEKDLEKHNLPKGKKRKLAGGSGVLSNNSDIDSRLHPLNINIIGKDNYLHVLTVYRDRMASEILRVQAQKGADAPFRRSYNEVCSLIDKVRMD